MSISRKINQSTISLRTGDITDMEVEAFVYYARNDLKLGAGYGNAIAVRGGPSIQKELDEIGELEVGEAAVTDAGNMKSQYIIHAVGPAGFYGIPLPVCADLMLGTFKKYLENSTAINEIIICALDKREHEPFQKRLENLA